MEMARKEVEDAESFLKETEGRLGVIDADMVTDSHGSKKQRKLSMSSKESDCVAVENNNSVAVIDTGTKASSTTCQSNSSHNRADRQSSMDNSVTDIIFGNTSTSTILE